MNRNIVLVALAAALLLVAWLLRGGLEPAAPVHTAAATAAATSSPAAASAAPGAPALHYPVPPVAASSVPATTFEDAVAELLVGTGSLPLFRPDDLARRFVATVDNLGRDSAPASMWPVQPAAGRFQTQASGSGDEVIAPANALRYAPYVRLLDEVDLPKAVRFYKAFYPALQRAYEDLGYPQGYFNDRFVQVLDQMLATPEARSPQHVHRPDNRSGIAPSRPWLLYEFSDPALQSLPAGQRLLLRMGPDGEQRVKVRLRQLRALLAAP